MQVFFLVLVVYVCVCVCVCLEWRGVVEVEERGRSIDRSRFLGPDAIIITTQLNSTTYLWMGFVGERESGGEQKRRGMLVGLFLNVMPFICFLFHPPPPPPPPFLVLRFNILQVLQSIPPTKSCHTCHFPFPYLAALPFNRTLAPNLT
jgi:hypothetical protein